MSHMYAYTSKVACVLYVMIVFLKICSGIAGVK